MHCVNVTALTLTQQPTRTPCRHVGAQQDARGRGAKRFECPGPFVLVDLPVQLVQLGAHDRRQGHHVRQTEKKVPKSKNISMSPYVL